MNTSTVDSNPRILVIDDNRAIHQDFRKILTTSRASAALAETEAVLFGEAERSDVGQGTCEIDSAYQGQDGIALVEQSLHEGRPYSVAFVDVRMPPGIDGVETTLKLWALDPDLQVVICTAYSDYSWEEMMSRIGHTDRMVILKKPFDAVEVQQLVHALGEKRRLLQVLKRKMNNLEEIVAERTRQLQNSNDKLQAEIVGRKEVEQQLVQSQKMEAIGRLAGGVAHDFNNILTAITGFGELALMRVDTEHPARRYLEEVRKAADRATALTRQLLAYGRRQTLQPVVLDLNTVVTDMGKMLRRVISEDIELVAFPTTGLWHTKADPGQIQQVIVNMAVNASAAMPKGGKLTITCANARLDATAISQFPDLVPGEFVMLSVTDTGSGMTPEVRGRIFEPFFTTKPAGQGTGLGLATCYGIVKQSGGHIDVVSQPGCGTTFKVYLPRVLETSLRPAVDAKAGGPPRGQETVLLVEDEPALRELARIVLTDLGYTVFTAGNGVEACKIAEQRNGNGFDLLFTDVVMPQMSGKELSDRILARHPETKVLFASGYAADAIGKHGILEPGVMMLPKPYTHDALAHKVREALKTECIAG